MNQAPWTDIGSLQSDVRQLRDELRNKAKDYEIHALNSRVDSLERACGQLRSEIDGLLSRMQEMEANIRQIELNQLPQ